MATPRYNYKSEEDIWESIEEKIKPLTLEQLEMVIHSNEEYLKLYKKGFSFEDEDILLMENIPPEEITRYYFPESAKNPVKIFISALGLADLAKKISDDPKEAAHLTEEFKKRRKKDMPSENELNEMAIEFNLSLRAHFLNAICLLNFKQSVNKLLIEGERNDTALTNAISIDKLLITLPLVRNRIKKAALGYDQKFFSLLGKAISNPLKIKGSIKAFRLALFAATLLGFRLSHLTYEEILQICDRYNIYRATSTEALSKQLNRVGFTKFEKTKRH